jgi:hypothetical protein
VAATAPSSSRSTPFIVHGNRTQSYCQLSLPRHQRAP